MRRPILAGVTAVAVLASTAAIAQEAGSRQTREFVQAAGHSDAFEKLEAATALTQSHDPQVQAFARTMLRDHNRLSNALQQATAHAGLQPPPMGVGADQAPIFAGLQSLKEPEFDRTYWKQQALAHHSALITTQQYAANGDSAAVRQAAASALPIITAHLAVAERMMAKSGGS